MLLQRFFRQLRQMPFLKRLESVHWKAKLCLSLFTRESTKRCTDRSCSHFTTSPISREIGESKVQVSRQFSIFHLRFCFLFFLFFGFFLFFLKGGRIHIIWHDLQTKLFVIQHKPSLAKHQVGLQPESLPCNPMRTQGERYKSIRYSRRLSCPID